MKLNKTIGRVATTLVATAMLASLAAVPTFAAPAGNAATTTSFTKKLNMDNADGASVPALNYHYTIGTDGVTGVNATATQPQIKVGVGTLNITNEVTFTADDLDKDVTVTIPANTYSEPGIYRYKVTETDNTANIAGMSDVTGDDTYYLDVYVVDNGVSLEAASFVWTREAITPNLQWNVETEQYDAVYGTDEDDALAKKVSEDVDTYTTYTLTVEKKTSGTMANDGGTFNFKVKINGVDQGTTVTVGSAPSEEAGSDGVITVEQAIVAPGEAGKSFVIKGIPADATYDVIEKLAATEGYTVTAKVNSGSDQTLTYDGTEDVMGYETSASMNSTNNTVVITNTRNAVSPTGIVMDVAPYALLVVIAAAGCFVFLRKRRED